MRITLHLCVTLRMGKRDSEGVPSHITGISEAVADV